MKSLKHGSLSVLAGVGLLMVTVLGISPTHSQESGIDDARAAMRGVYLSLTDAYVYSLNPEAFEDRANRDKIHTDLRALAAGAEAFEAHTALLDPSFDYMRRSLAHDAKDALARFESGEYGRSRWVLFKITENCMTCHSKLQAEQSFDLSREFLDKAPIKELAPSARAQLQVAMRQFSDALDSYEHMLRDPESSWATLSVVGTFENYLRLCLGVRDDAGRAVKSLRKYGKRDDLTAGQKQLVEAWVNSLESFDAAPAPKYKLAAARNVIEGAQRSIRYASDRSRLVDFIQATVMLHRFLKEDKRSDEESAEAYYLLAIAESHVSTSQWISETDFLLEQAIRKAPKSQTARDAYEFLVSYVTSGHASMWREMPDNVTHDLEELQALIDGK